MKRYIDAIAYRKELEEEKTCCERSEELLMGLEIAIADIGDMPTVDTVEVVHVLGVDRYGEKYENHLYECSICKEKALYKVEVDVLGHKQVVQALTGYCSNCGAKMDEERKNNE